MRRIVSDSVINRCRCCCSRADVLCARHSGRVQTTADGDDRDRPRLAHERHPRRPQDGAPGQEEPPQTVPETSHRVVRPELLRRSLAVHFDRSIPCKYSPFRCWLKFRVIGRPKLVKSVFYENKLYFPYWFFLRISEFYIRQFSIIYSLIIMCVEICLFRFPVVYMWKNTSIYPVFVMWNLLLESPTFSEDV